MAGTPGAPSQDITGVQGLAMPFVVYTNFHQYSMIHHTECRQAKDPTCARRNRDWWHGYYPTLREAWLSARKTSHALVFLCSYERWLPGTSHDS